MGLLHVIGSLQRVAALHAVIVTAQERLHAVEQGLAIQVEEEDGEQSRVDAAADQQQLAQDLQQFFIVLSSSYQLWESSNSNREGSSGSSCMTVVI